MTSCNALMTGEEAVIRQLEEFVQFNEVSQVALVVKNPPAKAGDIRDLGLIPRCEDPLEEGMATHSSIHAWRIPWTEEPGGLQPIGL